MEITSMFPLTFMAWCLDTGKYSFLITTMIMSIKQEIHIILIGKPEGKRPLGRPKRRWENNIVLN
jgi:hypothetical protein